MRGLAQNQVQSSSGIEESILSKHFGGADVADVLDYAVGVARTAPGPETGDRIREPVLPARSHDDVGSQRNEVARHGESDPRAPAGDDGVPAGEEARPQHGDGGDGHRMQKFKGLHSSPFLRREHAARTRKLRDDQGKRVADLK